MEKTIILYHGSEHIIEKPQFGLGKKHNDFGQGFYCTESEELAKEWAVSSVRSGYANRYIFNTEYLNILKLNDPTYNVLNWMAILTEHRTFSLSTPIARRAKQYLIDNFSLNVNAYDVIIGFRADDSYFDYAEAFLNNTITVEQLAKAMQLGKLGEQIVIKSKYAFSKLTFKDYCPADKNKYYILRKNRNTKANKLYFEMLDQTADGLFISDIIREKIKNDDSRIPRNTSE